MRWKVEVYEFELGWGNKVDFVEYFLENEHEKARKFVSDFNAKNTAPTAPDWYMLAYDPVLVEDAK